MQELIQSFSNATKAEDQLRPLVELIRQRALHQAFKEKPFDLGVQRLAQAAGDTTLEAERLASVAVLCRIGSVVKSFQPRLGNILQQALKEPLPALQILNDPDDRYYVASVWRLAHQPWICEYLASGAVHEEMGDRARAECIEGLLKLSPDLNSVLNFLREQVARIRFETQNPGDSMGRRFRRILEALRKIYAGEPIEPGDAGVALKNLVREVFQRSGQPGASSVTEEVSEEVLGLIHELVRARLSSATQTDTYSALEIVRAWFKESEWEKFTENSAAAGLGGRLEGD